MVMTYDRLKNRYWQYYQENGMVAPDPFFFNADGTIGNNSNNNERYWEITDGVLALLSTSRALTVKFETTLVENDMLILKGPHPPKPSLILCLKELRHMSARPQSNPTRDGLASQINRFGWSVGEHSYGVPAFLEVGRSNLVIGKYCSIAGGVKISFGDHNANLPSTFPFSAYSSFWPNLPSEVQHHTSKGDVVIGNDVWIGIDAFIGSGVTVGDGAVIGAKAVVTKDVPPYGIAVGNPARIARYRFKPDIIRDLLMLKWWELDDTEVDALLPVMFSGNMAAFLDALRKARGFGAFQAASAMPVAPPRMVVDADSELGSHYALFDPNPPEPVVDAGETEPQQSPGMLRKFQKLVGLSKG
jgi:acetyltransferase-like isoleucine patch superfamily enzyme